MSKRDFDEFKAYLRACTDAQLEGVYEKEDAAGRYEFAALALIELGDRLSQQTINAGFGFNP